MPTILCVDDSPRTLRLLGSILQLCGYSVLTVRDPDTALKMAGLKRFELAILDYQLPNWSGTSLAKAIKRIRPDVPIMLFSGSMALPKSELSSIDACVPKGESVDVMLHKIRSLLRHSGTHGLDRTDSEYEREHEPDLQTSESRWERWRREMEQHATSA